VELWNDFYCARHKKPDNLCKTQIILLQYCKWCWPQYSDLHQVILFLTSVFQHAENLQCRQAFRKLDVHSNPMEIKLVLKSNHRSEHYF